MAHNADDLMVIAALPASYSWIIVGDGASFRAIHRDGRAASFRSRGMARFYLGLLPYTAREIELVRAKYPETARRWLAINQEVLEA